LKTGEVFWVSGVKRNSAHRHWAGSGKVLIEAAAVQEYLSVVGRTELDKTHFTVTEAIEETDPADFVGLENRLL
jgi:hypothetical protein